MEIIKCKCDYCKKETIDECINNWIIINSPKISIRSGRNKDNQANPAKLFINGVSVPRLDFCGVRCLSEYFKAAVSKADKEAKTDKEAKVSLEKNK